MEQWDKLGLTQAYTFKLANGIPTLPLGTCICNSKICTYKQTIDTPGHILASLKKATWTVT